MAVSGELDVKSRDGFMSESEDSNETVVDFDSARKRVEGARKEQKEKDLEQKFKKAMGWKDKSRKAKASVKKKHGGNGPKPTKPRGKGKGKKR